VITVGKFNLLGVYDNPKEDDRYSIIFKITNGKTWEIAASEDGEVFFAMDITTADDWDKGEEISFDELPETVKEQVLLEWKDWDNQK
jgi:hypothetical protein